MPTVLLDTRRLLFDDAWRYHAGDLPPTTLDQAKRTVVRLTEEVVPKLEERGRPDGAWVAI
jgi:hypothetical protein